MLVRHPKINYSCGIKMVNLKKLMNIKNLIICVTWVYIKSYHELEIIQKNKVRFSERTAGSILV